MTWFTATSVTVNNGQTVVSVNAGDDIQLAQESGGLIIGNNPPVEIKRSYLDGSNNKKNRAAQPLALSKPKRPACGSISYRRRLSGSNRSIKTADRWLCSGHTSTGRAGH